MREHIDFKATLHLKSGKSKLVTCKETDKIFNFKYASGTFRCNEKNSVEVYVADSFLGRSWANQFASPGVAVVLSGDILKYPSSVLRLKLEGGLKGGGGDTNTP